MDHLHQARVYLSKNGAISIPYLMRKMQISHDAAADLCKKLGVDKPYGSHYHDLKKRKDARKPKYGPPGKSN